MLKELLGPDDTDEGDFYKWVLMSIDWSLTQHEEDNPNLLLF